MTQVSIQSNLGNAKSCHRRCVFLLLLFIVVDEVIAFLMVFCSM